MYRLFHDPTQKNPRWLLEDDQNNEPYSDLGSLPTEDITDTAGAHFAEGVFLRIGQHGLTVPRDNVLQDSYP